MQQAKLEKYFRRLNRVVQNQDPEQEKNQHIQVRQNQIQALLNLMIQDNNQIIGKIKGINYLQPYLGCPNYQCNKKKMILNELNQFKCAYRNCLHTLPVSFFLMEVLIENENYDMKATVFHDQIVQLFPDININDYNQFKKGYGKKLLENDQNRKIKFRIQTQCRKRKQPVHMNNIRNENYKDICFIVNTFEFL